MLIWLPSPNSSPFTQATPSLLSLEDSTPLWSKEKQAERHVWEHKTHKYEVASGNFSAKLHASLTSQHYLKEERNQEMGSEIHLYV